MLWRRVCVVAGLSVLASGCAYNDHFDNRVDRFDIAAEQSRDVMVLTNIVRASHAEPLSFVQLGKVTGANTSTVTVGLPALILGPLAPTVASANLQKDLIFGASGAGGQGYMGNSTANGGSTTFDTSPAETKEFYEGLLKEVDPQTLQLFIDQGLSRELLFYLFTDKLRIQRNGGVPQELRNDPLSPEFPIFQTYVKLAMDYGMSTEPVSSQHSGHSNSKSTKSDNKSSDKQSNDQNNQDWQICFNRTYMDPKIIKALKPGAITPICGSGKVSPDVRTLTYLSPQGEHVTLEVLPRSAFAIFQYLGRIVAAGDKGRIKLYSEGAIDQSSFRDDYLFQVETEGSDACFLTVTYEGQNYCIPMNGAANTKRIFSVLTQLIALNTSASTLPVTPTVQLLQ